MTKEELMDKLAKTISDGDDKLAREVSQEILAAGIDPSEAISQGAMKGLDLIGERYKRLEAFLPELIAGGEAMKACMAVFLPYISKDQPGGFIQTKVVIGTVSGDIHDIGKDMVATMLTASGFEVYNLGIDVRAKRFIEEANEVKAKVIALSALLTSTAYHQQAFIKELSDRGLRDKYYVVVGGAAISPEWATDIGADGYGRTAIDASTLVKKLVTDCVPPPLPRTLVVQ